MFPRHADCISYHFWASFYFHFKFYVSRARWLYFRHATLFLHDTPIVFPWRPLFFFPSWILQGTLHFLFRKCLLYVWHDSFICVTWLIYMCDMTHLYVWCDSLTCVTWLICMCDRERSWYSRHAPLFDQNALMMRVTWLMNMCDVTRWYVWHDSFICVTWLIHMCDMTHSYLWQDSFVCVTWLIHMCDMTRWYVWHGSCICVTWLIDMCDMAHLYMWQGTPITLPSCYIILHYFTKTRLSYLRPWCLSSSFDLSLIYLFEFSLQRILVTGWRRLIGSPKLQIIFHKRATKYRSLLRKMT